jgi:hypothetical protein
LTEVFLYGAGYGAGFCVAVAVFMVAVITAVTVWDKAVTRHRHERVIREAVGGLDGEDIAALLWGDENTGGGGS